MPKQLSDIDLHDGQILRTRVDHEQRTLAIDLAYYESMEDKSRIQATLSFSNVFVFSAMIEALAIEDNAHPGNISHWHPAEGSGTTFIYLVGGTIAVTAQSVSMEPRMSTRGD